MYRKILVAVDNSAIGNLLFQRALELAQKMSAQLLIMHGLSSEEEGSPLPIPPAADEIFWASGTETNLKLWQESWQRYETESLNRLQQFAAIANGASVETEFRQVVGSPGKAICKAAHEWGADLIVVGNRGRTGLAEVVLGSVSNYVLHRAPCSVLVLRASALVEDIDVAAATASHQ